jgi:chromate reductase, NAD(P)H dehydrogenase (quinone)
MIKILGLSGSLRAASVNTALLKAMAQLAPSGASVSLFGALASVPLFNPDLEGREAPAVRELRAALLGADAVVIASPEYAHGVTGVIKNALDWVVGSGELVDKPVALLIASTRSLHAPEALRKTLAVMGAHVVEGAFVAVPVNSSSASEAGILAMPGAVGVLRDVLQALTGAVHPGAGMAAPDDNDGLPMQAEVPLQR